MQNKRRENKRGKEIIHISKYSFETTMAVLDISKDISK
jgi:hypothetical protein